MNTTNTQTMPSLAPLSKDTGVYRQSPCSNEGDDDDGGQQHHHQHQQQQQNPLLPFILEASNRYFNRILFSSETRDKGQQGTTAGPARNGVVAKEQIRNESNDASYHDSYYPQTWLIAYFAVNGIHQTGPSSSPSSRSTRRRICLPPAVCEQLRHAIIKCCSCLQSHLSPTLSSSPLSSDHAIENPLCPPGWLANGLVFSPHHSQHQHEDKSSSSSCRLLPSSLVEVGICPDTAPSSSHSFPSSSSSSSTSSLGPTVTLTFCCLQTMLNVYQLRDDESGENHDSAAGDEDGADKAEDHDKAGSVSLLEEASRMLFMHHQGDGDAKEGSDAGAANIEDGSHHQEEGCDRRNQQYHLSQLQQFQRFAEWLLPHRTALFAWNRLRLFASSLSSSSLSSSLISDPRDLYSALMTLWLVYKLQKGEEKKGKAVKEGNEGVASGPTSSSLLLSSFVRNTWGLAGERGDAATTPPTLNVRKQLVRYLLEQCYVAHEGAFGAPLSTTTTAYDDAILLSDQQKEQRHKQLRAVEAHTGMTYCCTVSLILLGYFGDDGNGNTKKSFSSLSSPSPMNLSAALRRYLLARQAHFGLDVSEFEAYVEQGYDHCGDENGENADGDGEDDGEEDDSSTDENSSLSGYYSLQNSQRTLRNNAILHARSTRRQYADQITKIMTMLKKREGDKREERRASSPADEHSSVHMMRAAVSPSPSSSSSPSSPLPFSSDEINFRLPGFQGRPNKDSDTCYSFWALGALQALEGEVVCQHGNKTNDDDADDDDDDDRNVGDMDASCGDAKQTQQQHDDEEWGAVDAFLADEGGEDEDDDEEGEEEGHVVPPLHHHYHHHQFLLHSASSLDCFTTMTATNGLRSMASSWQALLSQPQPAFGGHKGNKEKEAEEEVPAVENGNAPFKKVQKVACGCDSEHRETDHVNTKVGLSHPQPKHQHKLLVKKILPVVAKDNAIDTAPDPVHGYLGMAGLSMLPSSVSTPTAAVPGFNFPFP